MAPEGDQAPNSSESLDIGQLLAEKQNIAELTREQMYSILKAEPNPDTSAYPRTRRGKVDIGVVKSIGVVKLMAVALNPNLQQQGNFCLLGSSSTTGFTTVVMLMVYSVVSVFSLGLKKQEDVN